MIKREIYKFEDGRDGFKVYSDKGLKIRKLNSNNKGVKIAYDFDFFEYIEIKEIK